MYLVVLAIVIWNSWKVQYLSLIMSKVGSCSLTLLFEGGGESVFCSAMKVQDFIMVFILPSNIFMTSQGGWFVTSILYSNVIIETDLTTYYSEQLGGGLLLLVLKIWWLIDLTLP